MKRKLSLSGAFFSGAPPARASMALVLLLCISCLKAFPISFVESVPADGSSITSFNFTLVFDISSDIGDDDKSLYGVGWSGSPYSSTKSRTLYRGQPGEGTVLGYALENRVVGSCVYGIIGSSVRVFTQGGQIVLEGLTSSDEVCVYTPAGVLVRSVRAESDTLRLTLDSGVYIVTVNGHAAKLSL